MEILPSFNKTAFITPEIYDIQNTFSINFYVKGQGVSLDMENVLENHDL